jgi:hypothetical protein
MSEWVQLSDRDTGQPTAIPVAAITRIAVSAEGTQVYTGRASVLVAESYEDVLQLIGVTPTSRARQEAAAEADRQRAEAAQHASE